MSSRLRAVVVGLVAVVVGAVVAVILLDRGHHSPPIAVPTPRASPAAIGSTEPLSPAPTPSAAPQVAPGGLVPSAGGGLQVGITFGNTLPSLSAADLASTLDGAVALGVRWIRLDLAWNDIQPTSAADADWSAFDGVVAAANARHLTVLPVLAYTPAWARPGGCTTAKCHPADAGQFATFAAAAAARYGPLGVHTWEIWNEPNAAHYWQPVADATQYVALVRAAVPAIRGADPGATIISGGLAAKSSGKGNIAQLDFLRSFCSQGGAQLVNAVGYHPYSFPVPPGYRAKWNAWQQIETTSTSFRSILDSCGAPGLRVWVTEYGAPTTGTGQQATTADYGIASHPIANHVSESLQSQMASDALRLARASTTIGGLFWYTYSDTPGAGHSFGLRRSDGSAKPAYAALQQALAAARSG